MLTHKKVKLKDILSIINIDNSEIFISDFDDILDRGYTLASVKNIVEDGLYFLTEEYIDVAEKISNSIILTDYIPKNSNNNIFIKVKNPQLVHYKISTLFDKKIEAGIHPSAVIHPNAIIDNSAYIGPYCVIGECIIGENVCLLSHITINDNVIINKNTVIEANSLIGARGMAWIWDELGNRIMQPQLGGVIIEEDCILGSDISIVRGSLSENTIIGRGTVMSHGSKVGHGCIIGKFVHFANNVSLAGNALIGERVFLGSGCVISSNVSLADGTIVGAGAVVNKSVYEKYNTLAGVPAKVIMTDNFNIKQKGVPKSFKN